LRLNSLKPRPANSARAKLPCEIPSVYIRLSSHSVVFVILFAEVALKEIKSKLIIACLVVMAGVFFLIAGGAFMDRSKTQPAQNSTVSRATTSSNSSNRPLTDEDRAAIARGTGTKGWAPS